MRTLLVIACVLCACGGANAVRAPRNGSRYGFWRTMHGGAGGDTRRVFGGTAAGLDDCPEACVLLDRYWSARCSARVLAPRWALTAAHCVTPRLAYVKYGTRTPAMRDGNHATVLYLYRHPKYKVLQEDEGRGMDVTVLHHDVGLVRVRKDMVVLRVGGPAPDPIAGIRRYNPIDLKNQEVQVLGFGRTETVSMGDELFTVNLRLVFCERGAWYHCICGIAAKKNEGTRGVCSGDSGGPVMYRGTQVGVTSMGPLECATLRSEPEEGATSVFTALYNYADVINATMHDTEEALRMSMVESSPAPRPAPRLAHLPALVSLALLGA